MIIAESTEPTLSAPAIHLIDTHCHLNHQLFSEDLEAVIERAHAASVREMIVVGYDLESSEHAVVLANRYSSVYAAVAVHPHDAHNYDCATEERLRELAADPRVAAIGEIGLDYHYDFSPREDQYRAFRAQIALAGETGLPIILHCREAYSDVLDVLEHEKPAEVGAVMHCWAGTQEEAERAVGLGCFLGFGGVLTFKNAEMNREVARAAPLGSLLVETDAPYLAPVPHRGKRNEPAYTRIAAEKLAEIRGHSLADIATAATANARRVFPRLIWAK